MALTIEEVRRIARLARLRLSPAEEQKLVPQLGEIVDYIDQLKEFATAESSSSAGSGLPEAEDRVAASLPREEFLHNAPLAMDRFLVVPRVKGSDDG